MHRYDTISYAEKKKSIEDAILNVIINRNERGADHKSLLSYLNHLKIVWRNSPVILEYIRECEKVI